MDLQIKAQFIEQNKKMHLLTGRDDDKDSHYLLTTKYFSSRWSGIGDDFFNCKNFNNYILIKEDAVLCEHVYKWSMQTEILSYSSSDRCICTLHIHISFLQSSFLLFFKWSSLYFLSCKSDPSHWYKLDSLCTLVFLGTSHSFNKAALHPNH